MITRHDTQICHLNLLKDLPPADKPNILLNNFYKQHLLVKLEIVKQKAANIS